MKENLQSKIKASIEEFFTEYSHFLQNRKIRIFEPKDNKEYEYRLTTIKAYETEYADIILTGDKVVFTPFLSKKDIIKELVKYIEEKIDLIHFNITHDFYQRAHLNYVYISKRIYDMKRGMIRFFEEYPDILEDKELVIEVLNPEISHLHNYDAIEIAYSRGKILFYIVSDSSSGTSIIFPQALSQNMLIECITDFLIEQYPEYSITNTMRNCIYSGKQHFISCNI